MLTLTMLPARQGDCIWIEYDAEGTRHHLVIDGGPEGGRVLEAEVGRRLGETGTLHIDLLVVTHIDNDHIGGVLELLAKMPEGLSVGDVWFNGYDHLPTDLLGGEQGDRLSGVLEAGTVPWNEAFGGEAVLVPDEGPLPRLRRKGALELTLLGPSKAALARLARKWDKEVQRGETEPAGDLLGDEESDLLGHRDEWPPDFAKLLGEPFDADPGAPNASSIALLLDYEGTRILLAADATAAQLSASVLRVLEDEQADRLRLDACKVSHHGSKKSTDRELLDLLRCKRWLISTDGSYFGHPDAAAVARLVHYGGPEPELYFNSCKKFAARWTAPDVPAYPAFTARLPEKEGQPVVLAFP